MPNFVTLGCLEVGEKFSVGWVGGGHFDTNYRVTPTFVRLDQVEVRLGCNNCKLHKSIGLSSVGGKGGTAPHQDLVPPMVSSQWGSYLQNFLLAQRVQEVTFRLAIITIIISRFLNAEPFLNVDFVYVSILPHSTYRPTSSYPIGQQSGIIF